MSERLTFDMVSPEKHLFSAEVDVVTVPGSEGDFGVLVNHSPMMSVLRPGCTTTSILVVPTSSPLRFS